MKFFALIPLLAALAAHATPFLPPVEKNLYLDQPRSLYEWSANLEEKETSRIQKHLLWVESYLRAFPGLELSPMQKIRRDHLLLILDDYAKAGVFPGNHGNFSPVFIDGRGVACAVGHLLRRSGSSALANRIKARDNRIYLPDVKDAGFEAWAARNGFTPQECALIQPSYCPSFPEVPAGAYFSEIRKVTVDEGGRIWIGTRHGAVAMWEKGKWTRFEQMASPRNHVAKIFSLGGGSPIVELQSPYRAPFFPVSKGIFPALSNLRGLDEFPKGTLWSYDFEKGLHKTVLRHQDSFFPDTSHDEATDLAVDASGVVWVAGSQGIRFYDEKRGWIQAKSGQIDGAMFGTGLARGLAGEMLMGINGVERGIEYRCEDDFAAYGFSRLRRVGDSLVVVAKYTHQNSPLPSDIIYGITPDSSSQSYLITTFNGIAKVDLQGAWSLYPKAAVATTSMDIDRNGVLWLGKADGNLVKVSGRDSLPIPGPAADQEGINPAGRILSGLRPWGWDGKARDMLGRMAGKNAGDWEMPVLRQR